MKYHLSNEQALKICDYFFFDPSETDYFYHLVQLAKAGDQRTKTFFLGKLESIRSQKANLKNRVSTYRNLDDKDQAQFYSDWTYAAINLLTAIDKFQTAESIAKYLKIELKEVKRVLYFLETVGLSKNENGKYTIGDARTFVSRDAPFFLRHLSNWRLKSMEHLRSLAEDEVMYTSPIVVSQKDFSLISEMIVKFLKEFRAVAGPSESEVLCCLNIDWIKVNGGN